MTPTRKEEQEKLWGLLRNELAHDRRVTLLDVLKKGSENGISLSPLDLWSSSARLGREAGGGGLCPPMVSDFIVSLLNGMEASAVLDPWVGFGTLLRPVVDALRPQGFVGIYPSADVLEGAQIVLPPAEAGRYEVQDLTRDAVHGAEEFDAIVSIPPFGAPRRKVTVAEREIYDHAGNALVLQAAVRLKPSGVGAFVVTPSFLFGRRPKSVISQLGHFGLYVDACFLFAEGTFRPLASIETYLVVIRRGEEPSKMFVAEASPSGEARDLVLANYRERRVAEEPELGGLVVRSEFKGLRQMISARTLTRQTARLRLPPRRLGDLCTSIIRCPAGRAEIPEVENSFFLPLVRPGQCRFDASTLPSNPREWAHVHVDPQLSEARVVAGFLDSPLGRLSIQTQVGSTFVPRLPFSSLEDVHVWLPDLDGQRSVIEVDQRLRSLGEEVEALRTQLWQRLDKADQVEANVERVNREDTFPHWLDTLPFPLASILWTYHTQKEDPLKAYNQLDHFFEALAEFLAVLLLSAVRQDESVFEEVWPSVSSGLSDIGMTLERTSMGTWVAVFENLAKVVRSDLDDADAREHWRRLFACDDHELLGAIISKKMVTVLKQANAWRNGWRGHGGIVGDDEARRRATEYVSLLLDVRGLLENRWENYPLVLARSGRYSNGLHSYSVHRVAGTRTPFDVSEIVLKQPMEDGQLHMVAPRLGVACPLLPFVRLGASPADAQSACYFYNRVQLGGVRYVSYHFETQPELIEPFPGARALLEELGA
jgi:hypothetical protein